jgi:hypothetical protein
MIRFRPRLSHPVAAALLALWLAAAAAPASATRQAAGSQAVIRTTLPPPRELAGMAGDINGNIVLFGGHDPAMGCCGAYGDTWTWNGSAWTEQFPTTSPSRRYCFGIAYDAARGQVVLFGGYPPVGRDLLADTWTWDGTDWTEQHPTNNPPGSGCPGMSYDSARHQVVLSVPEDNPRTNQTWTWDGTDWTQQHPVTAPWAATAPSMAYDGARRRTVLFGGYHSCFDSFCDRKQTFLWDGTNWMLLKQAIHPDARSFGGMAYDATRQKTVLFGGLTCCSTFGDTWTWDGHWTMLSPANSPDPRGGVAMAWDRVRRQIVLFGGYSSGPVMTFGDTWTWSGLDWKCVTGCA